MRLAVLGVAALAMVAAGCSGGEVYDGPDQDAAKDARSAEKNADVSGDDCTGRVKFRGVVYRSSNAVNENAPLGEAVGTADIVDCGDTTVVDSVRVRRVEGVDVETAIATTDRVWRAIYINEDIASDPSSWPEALRN